MYTDIEDDATGRMSSSETVKDSMIVPSCRHRALLLTAEDVTTGGLFLGSIVTIVNVVKGVGRVGKSDPLRRSTLRAIKLIDTVSEIGSCPTLAPAFI